MAADPHALSMPTVIELLTLLGAGVVVPPLLRRLRLSPVVGFLIVGVVVGPAGLAVFQDAERVAPIAELGVIFLMFAIGLELSFERLRALRGLIFGLGGMQLVVTLLAVAFVALTWELSGASAVMLGVCIAFSSTAAAMQLLSERRETAAAHGRSAFAVLLLQDLAVAPALILVEVLALGEGGLGGLAAASATALLRAAAAIAVIIVVGRFLLRRACRLIIAERSPELRMGATALIVVATAGLTNAAGLSAPLGAFLAGLLIAETPLRAQTETDLEPFRGILLGVFFIGVGLSLSPATLAAAPGIIVAAVIGFAMLKAAVVFAAARAMRRPAGEAARVAGLLAPCGEFGFVVAAAAATAGVLDPGAAQMTALVIALSIFASPIFDLAGRALAKRLDAETGEAAPAAPALGDGGVLLVGYGRVGRIVAKVLDAHGAEWRALDDRVPFDGVAGRVLVGDAANPELLVRAGLTGASALVVTVEDPVQAERVVVAARAHSPDLPVLARARDAAAAEALWRLGALPVRAESFAPGPQLASQALLALGAPALTVRALIDEAGLAAAPDVAEQDAGAEPMGAGGAAPRP